LSGCIDDLIREAPRSWLEAVCIELKSWPVGAEAEPLHHRLPHTFNGDLSFRLREVLRLARGAMSWEALACSIALCATLRSRWESNNKVELLWAGPAPATGMAARRIDQALYDLVSK